MKHTRHYQSDPGNYTFGGSHRGFSINAVSSRFDTVFPYTSRMINGFNRVMKGGGVTSDDGKKKSTVPSGREGIKHTHTKFSKEKRKGK